ncbi:hypothetical protein D3C72_673230 [compost metagenome]
MKPWSLLVVAALSVSACHVPFHASSTYTSMGIPEIPLSLPFRTLFTGEMAREYFQPGASEFVVLDSAADWAAFLTRHPRGMPTVVEMPPDYPGPRPIPTMLPLPENLSQVDYARYQVLVAFVGAAANGDQLRIVSVEEAPGSRVAHTVRWQAPPNAGFLPRTVPLMHVIAVPRGPKPLVFAPERTVALAPVPTGDQRDMDPNAVARWRAVPDPELTREALEAQLRQQYAGGTINRLSIEKRTFASLKDHPLIQGGMGGWNHTPDSEVWLVELEGDMPSQFPGGHRAREIGGTPDRMATMIMLKSIEDGSTFAMTGQRIPGKPGMRLELKAEPMMRVGEPLGFEVAGPMQEGRMKLTVQVVATGQEVVRELDFKDAAAFELPLDATTFPGLPDRPVLALRAKLDYPLGSPGIGHMERDIQLVRDADVQPMPALIAVSGNPGDYGGTSTAAAIEALARQSAEQGWRGTGLSVTSQPISRSEAGLSWQQARDVPASVAFRRVTVTGQFPKTLLEAVASGKNETEVIAPTRVVFVMTETTSIHVISSRGYVN